MSDSKKKKKLKYKPPEMRKSEFGGFSGSSYISSTQGLGLDKEGKPISFLREPDLLPSRFIGKSFLCSPPKEKKAKPFDFFGDKYLSLAVFQPGETDPSAKKGKKAKKEDPMVDKDGKPISHDPYDIRDRLALMAQKKKGKKAKKDDDDGEEGESKPKKDSLEDRPNFKFVSPPKKSCGPGTLVGTFDYEDPKGNKHMWFKDPNSDVKAPVADKNRQLHDPKSKREKVPDDEEHKLPLNILTNPGKKGTYGFVGITFPQPKEPVVKGKGKKNQPKKKKKKEKEVDPNKPPLSEYEEIRAKEREAWEHSKELMKKISKDGHMFKAIFKPLTTFDEKKTGVSRVFDFYDVENPPEDPLDIHVGKKKKKKPKKPKKKKKAKKDKKAEKKEGEEPPPLFKMTSGPKSGENGFFTTFQRMNDPPKLDPKEEKKLAAKKAKDERRKKRELEKAEKKKEADKAKGKEEPKGWKPVSGPKSGVIRSLLRRFY